MLSLVVIEFVFAQNGMDFFSGQVIFRLISRFMAKFHDFWARKGLRLLWGMASDSW